MSGKDEKSRSKLNTAAVHAGERKRRDDYVPISTPIYSSSTFVYDSIERIDRIAGGEAGYMYGRYHNPTNAALEECVARLEGADFAMSFSTGMAAMHAAILLSGVGAGDKVLCSENVYGATIGVLLNVFAPLGIDITLANFSNPDALRPALEARPRLVIAETLSNPLLRVLDIAELASATHRAGARLLLDSTFTSPVMVRPLELGADYVVHSATKYLAGHGDVMGGIVLAHENDRATLDSIRKLVGGILAPFEAWLVLRGVKTLPLRMERQCSNAFKVARYLANHPAVERVYYPGLPGHPDHEIAARQFADGMFGAVVSFETSGADRARMFRLIDSFKLCLPATSLGDVQTLILYPVIASHRDLSPKQRERVGIRENLLRVSVGIEDADDIIADLDQALRAATGVEQDSATRGLARV